MTAPTETAAMQTNADPIIQLYALTPEQADLMAAIAAERDLALEVAAAQYNAAINDAYKAFYKALDEMGLNAPVSPPADGSAREGSAE